MDCCYYYLLSKKRRYFSQKFFFISLLSILQFTVMDTFAQRVNLSIKGQVTTTIGEPLSNSSIQVKGSNKGISTQSIDLNTGAVLTQNPGY